jgi:hypothetical protein
MLLDHGTSGLHIDKRLRLAPIAKESSGHQTQSGLIAINAAPQKTGRGSLRG